MNAYEYRCSICGGDAVTCTCYDEEDNSDPGDLLTGDADRDDRVRLESQKED